MASAENSAPRISALAFDLLSLSMALVLGVHTPHLAWWFSGALALTLGSRWWQRRHQSGKVAGWLKFPLLLLLTLAVVAQYGSIFGRQSGTALAVGLLILKLLETETVRDVRVGISFACFALMAALLFGQGLVTTAVVALGLLPALSTLRALEPAQMPISLPRTLLPALKLTAAALPLALLGFLLVPRLSTPLWGAPSPGEAQTGLSDSMSPGNFTQLLTDDSPAMRVTFSGTPPPPEQRYFRAYVMSQYNGRTWRYDHASRLAPAALEVGEIVDYQISLEANHQRVLPTLDVPVTAPAGSKMRRDHVVMADRPVNSALTYSARSTTRYQLEPTLSGSERRWLTLPNGFNPRTLALAAQWRQRYGSDQAAIVQRALSLFHDGGFRYTLTPAPLGRDAVDDFLFDTQEGFCEHYSSSFTVLMRAAGIPARVVTGYQGGYWNVLGKYLLVRNSDAHAWAEVWLSGRGWVRVDPTASVRPERVQLGAAAAAGNQLAWYQNNWIQGLRNHWDIVNRWWTQGVIGFDSLRQRGLLTPFGIDDIDTATMGILLALGSIVFIGIGLGWALLRKRRQDPLREALRALEGKLARAGVVRRSAEGPQHYLSRAARALPSQREALTGLMARYLELRYAFDEPPPEPLSAFQREIREFRADNVVK